jgi:methyl-accepting chemotaxis protein
MTIKARLILLAAASLVAILVTSVISNVGNRLLSEVAEESSAFAQFRSLSDYDAQVSTLHLQYTLALQHNPTNTDVLKLHNHEVSMHFELYDKAKQALLNRRAMAQQHHKHSVFATQTQPLYEKMDRFLEIAQVGIDKMKREDFLGANDVLIKQLNAAAKAVGETSVALKEEILHVSQGAETKAKSVKDTVDILLLISGMIAFMIIAVLAWLVIRAISHSVKQTTDALAAITSTMNFSAPIPVMTDEMGAVANSVNQLIKHINNAMTEANTCVSALSKGNLNAQMNGHFVGDLDRLKQGINGSIANISGVMTFLSDVMLQMKKGNFHFEAHLQAEGAYQQMFNNTRDALHQVDAVLDSIHTVMSQMAQGDFDGRVTVEAAGRLLEIKQNMNHSMNAIAHAIIMWM